LRRITYALLRLGQKHGRVAVREPHLSDHLTMIEDLIFLEGLTIATSLGPWKKPLTEMESFRNKLAHGVWVKRPDSKLPILQDIKGNHPPEMSPYPQARKARINPKAMGVTIANLKNWTSVTDAAIRMLDGLGAEINGQRALQQKRQQRPQQVSATTPTIQTEAEPAPRPIPSPG
jgi:hypothetical protein